MAKKTFMKDSRFGLREVELELKGQDVNQFKLSQYVDKGRINDPQAHDYDVYCPECGSSHGHVRIAAVPQEAVDRVNQEMAKAK